MLTVKLKREWLIDRCMKFPIDKDHPQLRIMLGILAGKEYCYDDPKRGLILYKVFKKEN